MCRKIIRYLILSMNHKYPFWFLLHALYPCGQMILIRMTTDARQIQDFCIDMHCLTEKFYLFCAVQQLIT